MAVAVTCASCMTTDWLPHKPQSRQMVNKPGQSMCRVHVFLVAIRAGNCLEVGGRSTENLDLSVRHWCFAALFQRVFWIVGSRHWWCVQVIKAITPLIRKLGPKANPGNLKHIPKAAIAGWAFYVGMPITDHQCTQ